MKRCLTLLFAAVLLVACGGGNKKAQKETQPVEIQSIEAQAQVLLEAQIEALKVGDIDKADSLSREFDEWFAKLNDEDQVTVNLIFENFTDKFTEANAIAQIKEAIASYEEGDVVWACELMLSIDDGYDMMNETDQKIIDKVLEQYETHVLVNNSAIVRAFNVGKITKAEELMRQSEVSYEKMNEEQMAAADIVADIYRDRFIEARAAAQIKEALSIYNQGDIEGACDIMRSIDDWYKGLDCTEQKIVDGIVMQYFDEVAEIVRLM